MNLLNSIFSTTVDMAKAQIKRLSVFDIGCVLVFMANYCKTRDIDAAYQYILSASLLDQIRFFCKAGHNILLWLCYILFIALLILAFICDYWSDKRNIRGNILYFILEFLRRDLDSVVPLYALAFSILFLVKLIIGWQESLIYETLSTLLFIYSVCTYIIGMGQKYSDLSYYA